MTQNRKLKLIMIGGYGRSGTTLLERLLGQISGMCCTGELAHIWRRCFVENQLCSCGMPFHDCDFWAHITLRAYGDDAARVAMRMCALERMVGRLRQIPRTLIASLRTSGFDQALAEYRDGWMKLYRAVQATSGARVVIDSSKSPSHVLMLAPVADVELYLVHVVRDSRGVAHSWRRTKHRPEVYWKREHMPRYSVGRVAAEWNLTNLLLFLMYARGMRYHLVWYDELAQQTRQCQQTICRFCREPHPDLSFLENGAARLGRCHTVSGNPIRFVHGMLRIEPDDVWKAELSKLSKFMVDALTWPSEALRRYVGSTMRHRGRGNCTSHAMHGSPLLCGPPSGPRTDPRRARILFLCAETFPPQYAFLEKVFNEILLDRGFSVEWIMPSPSVTSIQRIKWGGNHVWLFPRSRPVTMFSLIPNYVAHLALVGRATSAAHDCAGPFAIVQIRDDPVMAYVGWRLARREKVPFVYQLSHLKEEENLLCARMGLYGSRAKNLLKGAVGFLLRNHFLRKADHVLPISRTMGDTLAKYGIPRARMSVLPEGVDTQTLPAQFDDAALALRHKYGLVGARVLVYVGTMNRFRQLDLLVRVLQELCGRHEDLRLLMVGDGLTAGDLDWLKSIARQLGVCERIIFTGAVPRADVAAHIRLSDVALSPFPPNYVLRNNSPIKLLEYLALEVPAVATAIPSQADLLHASQGGLSVPHTVDDFAVAVEQLLVLEDHERKKFGERGRRYIISHRDFRVLARTPAAIYERLTASSR